MFPPFQFPKMTLYLLKYLLLSDQPTPDELSRNMTQGQPPAPAISGTILAFLGTNEPCIFLLSFLPLSERLVFVTVLISQRTFQKRFVKDHGVR